MKKWKCSVCGYVHEGDAPPEKCPICGVPASKFVELVESNEGWADEHKVGQGKDTGDNEFIEWMRAEFMGECTEVGMYLAMARQAYREGFPEIGEAYKRIAFEEAEHAAHYAELLGEVVTNSTAKNIEMRANAERGACEGKLKMAKLAKERGYDAIHDAVHEMCKDEARHGMAFVGMLKRYF